MKKILIGMAILIAAAVIFMVVTANIKVDREVCTQSSACGIDLGSCFEYVTCSVDGQESLLYKLFFK